MRVMTYLTVLGQTFERKWQQRCSTNASMQQRVMIALHATVRNVAHEHPKHGKESDVVPMHAR